VATVGLVASGCCIMTTIAIGLSGCIKVPGGYLQWAGVASAPPAKHRERGASQRYASCPSEATSPIQDFHFDVRAAKPVVHAFTHM